MQWNGNFKQWFNIFLIISEAWQGYESKAYGVSNHNLKLQSKKLSRTRDIPNFPTQGWADTAFCTRKRSETYISKQSTFYLGHINNWLQNGPPSFKVLLKIHQSPNWRFLLPLTLKLVYLNLHVFDLHSRHIQGSFVWQSTRTNDFLSTHRTSYRNTEGKEETRCRPISSPLLIMPTTTCYRVSIMPYWCS